MACWRGAGRELEGVAGGGILRSEACMVLSPLLLPPYLVSKFLLSKATKYAVEIKLPTSGGYYVLKGAGGGREVEAI